jgi:hypothetical protein
MSTIFVRATPMMLRIVSAVMISTSEKPRRARGWVRIRFPC